MGFQIAIDGPAGSGKSTVARELAQKLSFTYIDTGAMYRAVGLYVLRNGISLSDAEKIAEILPNIGISIKHTEGEQRIFLCGEDVSESIRSQEIANAASKVAAYIFVREALVEMQRALARDGDIVMDGRDIGSHVLPGANLKIYLDAPPEIRASRRLGQLRPSTTVEEALKDTLERDEYDMNREHSPLMKTADAILIDTGDIGIEAVTDKIYEIAKQREGL